MNSNNINNHKYTELDIKIISKLLWEEKHILHDHKQGKGFLSVTTSKRFNSYIFKGTGSKNSLKQFMHFNNDFKIAVQIMDKNGYRQFIPFKSWNHCWDSYKHEAFHKRYLYEVILSDKPCKPYLDIEWNVKRSYKDKHLDFLNKIKSEKVIYDGDVTNAVKYFPQNIKPEQLRTIQPDKSINNLLYLKNHKLLAMKNMLSPKTSI